MKKFAIAALLAAAVGCTGGPYYYQQQPWAEVSYEQASAECHSFINTQAGWGSNMYLCMKAKGWLEVRGVPPKG